MNNLRKNFLNNLTSKEPWTFKNLTRNQNILKFNLRDFKMAPLPPPGNRTFSLTLRVKLHKKYVFISHILS